MSKTSARCAAPYPLFAAARRDLYDARILQGLYAGRESETTAIMQYCFQSYVLGDTELSRLLSDIARTEMLHHRLLGRAIAALGKPPMIASETCFWSGSAVDHSESAVNILERDIEDEKRACAAYMRAAKLVHSPSLAALLTRIADDERLHAQLLTERSKALFATKNCGDQTPQ